MPGVRPQRFPSPCRASIAWLLAIAGSGSSAGADGAAASPAADDGPAQPPTVLFEVDARGADCALVARDDDGTQRESDLPLGDLGMNLLLAPSPAAPIDVRRPPGVPAEACPLRRTAFTDAEGNRSGDRRLARLLSRLGLSFAQRDWQAVTQLGVELEAELTAADGPLVPLACVTLARLRLEQGASNRGLTIIENCPPGARTPVELARLTTYAELLQNAGDFDRATDMIRQAIDLAEEQGTVEERTLLDSRLGFLLAVTGDTEGGSATLRTALRQARALGQPHLIGEAANNMASLSFLTGDFSDALDLLEEAHAALVQAERPVSRIDVVNNLGLIYTRSGSFERALAVLQDGLPLLRFSPDVTDEALLYSQLGYTYLVLGDTRRAAVHLRRAVALYEQSDERWRTAMIRRHLGTVERELGRPEAALEAHLASLSPIAEMNLSREHAHVLNELARDSLALERLEQAEHWLDAAIAMRTDVHDPRVRAESMGLKARLLRRRGETGSARELLLAALDEFADVDYPPARLETLMALFALERDAGHLPLAFNYGRAALDVAESQGAVLETERLGPAWARRTHESFNAVALTMLDEAARTDQSPLALQALELLERSRAAVTGRRRTLVAGTGQGGVADGATSDHGTGNGTSNGGRSSPSSEADHTASGPDEPSAQLERMRQRVALASLRRISEPEDAALDTAYYQAYDRYQAALRTFTSARGAPAEPSLPSVTDSLARLSDNDTVLYFVLGEDVGYVVVAGHDGVRALVPVPGAERARRHVRALRRAIQSERKRRPFEAHTLANEFLHPALSFAEGDRLLLVADGPLHTAPMASLPAAADSYAPLVSRYSVVSVPALHLYAPKPPPAAPGREDRLDVVVLADPRFRGNPAGAGAAAVSGNDGDARRNWRAQLGRLPYSAEEAEAIASLLPSNRLFLANEATREALFSPDTRAARIVHIATHGYFRESTPDIVGIALSPTATDDGFVTLTDLFGARFGSELVVISGCETGLGEAVGGEGLNSLARGFLSQGVGATLSTLWSVSDEASAVFMGYFYEALIAQKDPAAALRDAQQRMLDQRRYESPFYWAGYVLHGTGTPLTLRTGRR